MTSLNKPLFNGLIFCTFFFLHNEIKAQPIQLIPKADLTHETPFSKQDERTIPSFWEGTPPTTYETYIDKLPLRLSSFILQKMRAKVLSEKFTPASDVQDKLFSLSLNIGDFDNAEKLLSNERLEGYDELWVRLQWTRGDPKAACHKIGNLLRANAQNIWKVQNVYCLFLNGELERARVADELLREASLETHPLVSKLFDSSINVPFDKEIANSPFLLNVWCTLGLELSSDELSQLSPGQLHIVANGNKVPPTVRLNAALQAKDLSQFPSDHLVSLLRETSDNDLFHDLLIALENSQESNLPSLFEKGAKEHQLELIAKTFSSLLSQLTPSKNTAPIAPYLIRTFLSIQEYGLAQKWYALLKQENPDAAIALLPLMYLADSQNQLTEEEIRVWQAYQTKTNPNDAAKMSYILRSILEALGENNGSPMEGEPVAPSWRQEKAILGSLNPNLLNAAATSNRIGEVYLLILASLQADTLAHVPVEKITHFVRALKKVSKGEQAKALAIEYLINKGL